MCERSGATSNWVALDLSRENSGQTPAVPTKRWVDGPSLGHNRLVVRHHGAGEKAWEALRRDASTGRPALS